MNLRIRTYLSGDGVHVVALPTLTTSLQVGHA